MFLLALSLIGVSVRLNAKGVISVPVFFVVAIITKFIQYPWTVPIFQ